MNTVFTLISICLISVFIIVFPITAKRLAFTEADKDSVIYHSLRSTEFKYALIISLSVSIPLIFELFIRVVLMKKSLQLFLLTIAPSTITLLLLSIPDLVYLFYVNESGDMYVFVMVMYSRLIIMLCTIAVFLSSAGGKVWSSRGLIFVALSTCTNRILSFYRFYISGNAQFFVAEIFPIALNILTIIVFLYMSYKWFHHVYQETKTKPLTTDQYMCSVYVFSTLVCWVGLTINQFIFKNGTDWLQWDANALTTHISFFTVFYVLIIVFEGRVMQREMVQTKASSFHCLL